MPESVAPAQDHDKQPSTVILIDLSSIAYPIWHTSGSDPDPNKTSQQVIARVRTLAGDCPSVVICCDSGRSFRKDIAPTYKANREAAAEPLKHQIELAKELLEADGFPVVTVPGFEADDIIATATVALAKDNDVVVVSADKDLLQLVGGRVTVKNATSGAIFDADAVGAKFGVLPGQMRDYLTLVGDASDNIIGAKNIGPKTAAELLARFGDIDRLYTEIDKMGGAAIGLKPSVTISLREFRPSLDITRQLVTMRTDLDLPALDSLMKPRVERAPAPRMVYDEPDEPVVEDHHEIEAAAADGPAKVAAPPIDEQTTLVRQAAPVPARQSEILPAPSDWERQLDPRTMREAQSLAENLHASRMFSAYGSPQAVLATIMVGRELGIPAMGSLRTIHNIEGRHGLSAGLMVALVLKSGLAEYFEPVSFDMKQATFVTKRKGARSEVTLQHTIEMAEIAGLLKRDSNWLKVPADMLVARAQSRLARMVYPDLLAGLYTPDELRELRAEAA